MKQSEMADQLGYSSSTIQRNRNDINMLSSYRIQPNNQILPINEQKSYQIKSLLTIHIENMTSRDLNWRQITSLNLT